MEFPTVRSAADTDWRTIAALNTVSALAQIGQFGIAFMVLPLWLAHHGLNATQLGLFASSLWFGQLPGLAFAPWLSRRFGPRRVILGGLACTIVALIAVALGQWVVWLPAGALAGFGLGLRWIGLEPWLYHVAPGHARGRLVGFHETLIGLAPIIAPALASWLGIDGYAPFLLGIGFTAVAVIPLTWARPDPHGPGPASIPGTAQGRRRHEQIFVLGLGVALIGGMTESAFAGLFPLFGQGRQLNVNQIADLLTVFGLGGLLLQYLIGWLADHQGMGVAILTSSIGILLGALALSQPLTGLALNLAVFVWGGLITAYLTLALIASTKTVSGSMSSNVSTMSMVYTSSAILGPLLAGTAIDAHGGDALVWCIGALALVLSGTISFALRRAPAQRSLQTE